MLKYKIPQIVTLTRFRIVVDEKEKRAKLCCLTLSILVFYVKCFIINLLGPPDAYSNRAELHPELRMQR